MNVILIDHKPLVREFTAQLLGIVSFIAIGRGS